MLENKKVIFMGTPYFAKCILETLLENNVNVIAVVTQPDKPTGRKHLLTFSEVKIVAIENNIPVYQPQKIRNEYEDILALKPDYIITCAYGQIIPKAILDACLCINVHASLLPKYRGGAPMQRVIMNNEEKTGITIMTMSEKMDAGDIIEQEEVIIEHQDTLKTLEEKLIQCACPLLINTLEKIENKTAIFTKQKELEVSFGFVITKEEEKLSFDKESYLDFYNHARALIDDPCGYVYTKDQKKLKICALHTTTMETNEENGTIIGLVDKGIGVSLDQRIIVFDEVLLEGKTKQKAKEFLNGAGRNLILSKLF